MRVPGRKLTSADCPHYFPFCPGTAWLTRSQLITGSRPSSFARSATNEPLTETQTTPNHPNEITTYRREAPEPSAVRDGGKGVLRLVFTWEDDTADVEEMQTFIILKMWLNSQKEIALLLARQRVRLHSEPFTPAEAASCLDSRLRENKSRGRKGRKEERDGK